MEKQTGKLREVWRGIFTRTYNKLAECVTKEIPDLKVIRAHFNKLQADWEKLSSLDQQILDFLIKGKMLKKKI